MKRISKETNIAFCIMLLVSIVMAAYTSYGWIHIACVFVFYAILLITVKRINKKYKQERNKRNALMFDESAHYHENK